MAKAFRRFAARSLSDRQRAAHIGGMTRTLSHLAFVGALALALSVSAPPALAQDGSQAEEGGASSDTELAEGAEMVAEGFRKLFRGLVGELEPAGEAAEEGWSDFVDWLGDLSAYEAPERLPNGDILIRRKDVPVPEVDL